MAEPPLVSWSVLREGVVVVRFHAEMAGTADLSWQGHTQQRKTNTTNRPECGGRLGPPGTLTADHVAEFERCLITLSEEQAPKGLVLWLGDAGTGRGTAALDSSLQAWSALGAQRSASELTTHLANAMGTLRRLATGPYVTIAAIDGTCTGLSVELASWCDWRIACSANTDVAFRCRQTLRGVVPFLGAVMRLPQIVGLERSVQTLAGALPIDLQTALKWGLVDEIVPDANQLLAAGLHRVERAMPKASKGPERRNHRPISTDGTKRDELRTRLQQWLTQTDHPAPKTAMATLSLIADLSDHCHFDQAIEQVAEVGAAHLMDPALPALAHVDHLVQHFESDRRLSSESARVTAPVTFAPVRTVGICGAGMMGEGIAAANLRSGITVRIYDASSKALDRAITSIGTEVDQARTDPWKQSLWPADALHNLEASSAEAELAKSDLLIESIVENEELKQQILGRLEAQMDSHAILASNTSTISVTNLATSLQVPQRFCGLHFCNPARTRRLVEVVRADATSDATILAMVKYTKQIGKLPIVVRNRPGFLINRLLSMYLNEAMEMLCQGMAIETIDRSARTFGMPLGPFELLDLIGIDTAMMAGRTIWEAFPDRVALTPVLPALVKRDRLGWKTQVGFYRYRYRKVPGRAEVDPQLATILDPYIRPRPAVAERDITTRLLLPMIVEATRVLDERVVDDVRDIDAGTVFGLAFPARRGGLLYWADQIGATRILEQLKRLEHLGPRMQPTERLKQMAAGSIGFHQSVSGT